jgi:hypothetical protein
MSSMGANSRRLPEVFELYLELAQYPILADRIRERMRKELFSRGVISPEDLEREVEEKAMLSQKREGLTDPYAQEPSEIWTKRLTRIRDNLTDFYFAHNLPHDLFKEIVQSVVTEGAPYQEVLLTFNPELAPQDVLFVQAEQYEAFPAKRKAQVLHHLEEIRVVLIKGMVSDQLAFVSRAKEFLTLSDLKGIYRRRIGRGKIGGKAAGMLLAWQALQREDPTDPMDVKSHVAIPDSYFIGSDVYYDVKALNDLVHFMNQKYKTRDEIEAEYPQIREAYRGARFPEEVIEGLKALLREVGNHPLIVRSSSLLEDSFDASFAGKYESFFCPNQGTPEENLEVLTDAISRVYASVLSPEALLYRRHHGLTDYDERMAVLIQKVQGRPYRNYFFPTLAGVAFGRNPFRWTQRIRREDGLLRLVWGLGTRAVDRVADDYPRMIALSHPELRPEKRARDIHRYSQRFIDLLDLEANTFETLPVAEAIADDYPFVRELASLDRGDWIQPLYTMPIGFDPHDIVLTFDNLLSSTDFVPLMSAILKKLERQLQYVADIEFTVDIVPGAPQPQLVICLLQCRPLSSRDWAAVPAIPADIPAEDRIFSANQLVPQGHVSGIRYVVYVDPRRYSRAPDYATKSELARLVGRLNKRLEGHRFILMGPGRWGSTDLNLGVKVTYTDIYNASVLVEIAADNRGGTPEASYGTHFFQDLVEARIYPLALYPGDPDTMFNWSFFEESPNMLETLLPEDAQYAQYVKVIDVPAVTGGRFLEIVMNGEQEEALGYLTTAE